MKLPELVEQYQRIEEELQELKFLLISLKRPQNFLHHLENTSLCHIPTCDEIFKVDLKCQDLNRTATYE